METKAVKSQMRRIIPSIAIISGFVVAFALAQEVMAQSAPAAEDDVKVKGAFDADDVAGGSGRKGETPAQVETKKHYSPYADRKYPTHVFFGDTHHHTANSGDAFMAGDRLSRSSRIASRAVRKSSPRPACRPSCRVRWTFSSSPITRRAWA